MNQNSKITKEICELVFKFTSPEVYNHKNFGILNFYDLHSIYPLQSILFNHVNDKHAILMQKVYKNKAMSQTVSTSSSSSAIDNIRNSTSSTDPIYMLDVFLEESHKEQEQSSYYNTTNNTKPNHVNVTQLDYLSPTFSYHYANNNFINDTGQTPLTRFPTSELLQLINIISNTSNNKEHKSQGHTENYLVPNLYDIYYTNNSIHWEILSGTSDPFLIMAYGDFQPIHSDLTFHVRIINTSRFKLSSISVQILANCKIKNKLFTYDDLLHPGDMLNYDVQVPIASFNSILLKVKLIFSSLFRDVVDDVPYVVLSRSSVSKDTRYIYIYIYSYYHSIPSYKFTSSHC